MSLKHIFISHSGADAQIASQLAENLRNAGHDTRVDTHDLDLGSNSIAFMNDNIEKAHTVIVLFSKHTKKAKWQMLEIDSAVWNEIAQGGGLTIIVRLDDTKVPPVLGRKVYGKLDKNDPKSLASLVEAVCKAALPGKTASTVMAEAMQPASKNPFRHLRAEFFENRPDLHAKTFAPPDALTVGAFEEMKPCFLEGSRGTGKSMLLLSLRARNFLVRQKSESGIVSAFGFYLKLSRGAICNVGIAPSVDGNGVTLQSPDMSVMTDVAAQEIYIQMCESLLSELAYSLDERLIGCEPLVVRSLVGSLDTLLFDSGGASTLEQLLEKLADCHKRVSDFIRRRFIYGEHPNVPIATFDLEQLRRVIKQIRRHVPALKDTMFVILLDEYENLFPYQQRIVNGLVKLGPPDLSVKIAKKLGSSTSSGTTSGQELQETHDYTRISLVYDVEDPAQRRSYYALLRHIVANILRIENLGPDDVDKILPEDGQLEVPEEKQRAEIARLCKATSEQFATWPAERRREKTTYYGEAATYRVLLGGKGRHAEKQFAGFTELAFVSSGVIRYFQEILGVAYHLTFGTNAPPDNQVILPAEMQTQAVHFVSRHNLTTLSRNVERHGEELKYFLLDVGDCLRYKLLRHSSEPEAARLTIEDPERLEEPKMAPLKRLLSVGILEGVFQTKEGLPAFKPKHSSDPHPSEFNISRIYAPVLEISPRLRWRTTIKCSLLLNLLAKGNRAEAMQHLKGEMVKVRAEHGQTRLDLG